MLKYKSIFDALKTKDIEQFKSYLSASQYIKSYGLIEKYVPPNSKVLDWGNGNAHFSYFLAEKGFSVTGFTIAQESDFSALLKTTHKNYQSVILPEAVAKLPFADKQFDAVASIGVLEHVRETGGNEIESLREIKRVLKPGGFFICTHLPNKYSWIEFFTANIKSKFSHPFKYNRTEIFKMAATAGLEIIETKRYGFLPRLMFKNIQAPIFAVYLFNFCDTLLTLLFSIFCQNHFFVFRNTSKEQ